MDYCQPTGTLVFGANLRRRSLVKLNLENAPPLLPEVIPVRGWSSPPVDWAPDGKNLLLQEPNSLAPAQPLLLNLDSGNVREFRCVPPEMGPVGWNATGSHIFVRSVDSLYVATVDGSELASLNYKFSAPPRSTEVINARGPGALSYLQIKEGFNLHFLPVSPESGVSPDGFTLELDVPSVYAQINAWSHISPDGTQLAITEFKREILLYDMATKEKRILPLDLGIVQNLRWSWDGKWIYCDGLGGQPEPRWMGRVDPLTGDSELLWTSAKDMLIVPFTSPDGKTLVTQLMEMGTELFLLEGL